jgi:dihydrofolate reductase
MISLIAAIGKNNELEKGNNSLWPLPTDQKYFREVTTGNTVIMERKNFESIGRLIPNRRNIVIAQDLNYKDEGAETAHSLKEALDLAKTNANENERIFIIGSAETYKQAMPLAEKLYITKIDGEDKEADSFFPEINKNEWQEVLNEEHDPDEQSLYKYNFIIYARKV